MRKRTIRKIGNSYFIALSISDIKDFNLKEGKELDVEGLLEEASKNE